MFITDPDTFLDYNKVIFHSGQLQQDFEMSSRQHFTQFNECCTVMALLLPQLKVHSQLSEGAAKDYCD